MTRIDKFGKRAQLLRTNYPEVVQNYKNKLNLQESKRGKSYSDEQLDRIVDDDLVSWSRVAFTNMINDDGIEHCVKKALSRDDVNNLGAFVHSMLKKITPNSSGAARYIHTQTTQASYEANLFGVVEDNIITASEEDEFPDFEALAVAQPVVSQKVTKTVKSSKSNKVRLETLVTPEVKAQIEQRAKLAGQTLREYAGVVLAQSV